MSQIFVDTMSNLADYRVAAYRLSPASLAHKLPPSLLL